MKPINSKKNEKKHETNRACCLPDKLQQSGCGHPEPQERQQYEQRLPHEVPNPEKIATQMTDRMQESLQLTEKQYKKIYKLNLKEQKEHFKAMQNSGEQRPPMGGRA